MKRMVFLIIMIFLGGCIRHTGSDADPREPVALADVVEETKVVFTDIQSDMEQASFEVAAAEGDTKKIRETLGRLYAEHSYAADVSFITTAGIMRIIEPPVYRRFQGTDISAQKHIRQMIIDHRPSMSESFKSVEGFLSVALQYPVMKDNQFKGSVDMLVRPETLLKKIIEPLTQGLPVDIWVMEPTGRILYDPDKEEIGRNIFTDNLYKPFPGLLDAARLIAKNEKGSTIYGFKARDLKESVKKYAYWNTVTVFGSPWRIVLTKAEKEGVNGKKTLEELGIKNLNEAFREFVALEEMQDAIGRKDKPYLLSLFQEFYTNNPGLYCVAWVDEKCVTRYGYPLENSLINYQFTKAKNPEQIQFIRAVKAGKEVSIEMPLLEGNTGQLLLCPVTARGKYRGMVYYLRIKP